MTPAELLAALVRRKLGTAALHETLRAHAVFLQSSETPLASDDKELYERMRRGDVSL